MNYTATRLPSRFPVGTKFVIESRPTRAGQPPDYSRHLEFPDGTYLPLPSRTPKRSPKVRQRVKESA